MSLKRLLRLRIVTVLGSCLPWTSHCVAEYTSKYRTASLFGSGIPMFRHNQYHNLHTDTIRVILYHFPILTANFPVSPTEMSFHLHRLFPHHQLKCFSSFTANFPLSPTDMPFHLKTYFPVTSFFVPPSLQLISLRPVSLLSSHIHTFLQNSRFTKGFSANILYAFIIQL